MLAIKFRRIGKRKQSAFRIVVAEKKSKLDGRFIEDLGFYNPRTDQFNVDQPRTEHWISVGAQPTDSVHNLLITAKVIKGDKVPVHSKSKKAPEVAAAAPTVAPSAAPTPTETPPENIEEAPGEAPAEPAA